MPLQINLKSKDFKIYAPFLRISDPLIETATPGFKAV